VLLDVDDGLDPSIYEPNTWLPLQKMILVSLLTVKDPDIRRKLAANVILSGGGSHLEGLTD
jgi:hypothetical protein